MGNSLDQIRKATAQKLFATSITMGTVVDVNDPMQLGRVRVVCPTFGESIDQPLQDIPWANNGSGIIGNTFSGTRGPNNEEEDTTAGGVTYGFQMPVQISAQAIIACIDGNTNHRVLLGTLPPMFTTNTLPHGRFSYQDTDGIDGEPDGPLSTEEGPIQPLYKNQTSAFTAPTSDNNQAGPRKNNYEWRTRGADYNMSAMRDDLVDRFKTVNYINPLPDDRGVEVTEKDGNTFTHNQGYGDSRILPDMEFENTYNKNKAPTIGTWTTPGFHSISMDDRIENCRMRFRTTSGHQILLDDTNERIYISTAEGRNWVEMDQDGNVDVYSKTRISIHSEGEVNLTSDKTLRLFGKEGVHINSSAGEVRAYSFQNMHLNSNADMYLQTTTDMHLKSGNDFLLLTTADVHLNSGANLYSQTVSDFHLNSGGTMVSESVGQMNLKSAANIIATGSEIHWNGPPASSAANADSAGNAESAFFTNRVPAHEPWGRTLTLDDTTHSPKYGYDDPNIGKDDILLQGSKRGPFWHR